MGPLCGGLVVLILKEAKMSEGLLLVDLQNDYFKGGRMELVDIEKAAANAKLLLKAFRARHLPVIHVQHISIRSGAGFFLPGTDGAAINPNVLPMKDEILVRKSFPNGFRDTELLGILKKSNVTDLTICGAMSHMCIDATTRAAFDLGFSCSVVEDACATKDLVFRGRTLKSADVHAAFMAALSVPYAEIVTTKQIV